MNTPTATTVHTIPAVRPATYTRTAGAAATETRCSTCPLKGKCVTAGMSDAEVLRMDELKFARRRIKEGEALYGAGQEFGFVYAVRSGTFKSVLTAPDGREQVSGFSMAGDLLGVDGLASGSHATTVVAIEDAEVCAIPYAQLARLGADNPRMYLSLSRLMSSEIVREHRLMVILGSMAAEERLAAFLVDISDRMKARGYSASEFHLRMWRVDIGSYLGMKIETVSRTFSSFQRQRILKVDKKHVQLLDIEALRSLAGHTVH
jgi:CRP/FNR family transcriptional regulator